MHTAEIENHAPAKFRWMRSEDTTLAFCAAWTLGLGVATLAGFYFGTIAGHNNHPEGAAHQDLDVPQLIQALPYAASGLILGIVFALWITFRYVPKKLAELEHEQGGH